MAKLKFSFSAILLSLLCINLYAQDTMDLNDSSSTTQKLRPKDRFVNEIFVDNWSSVPEKLEIKVLRSLGVQYYLMNDIPFGKSNFSFAFGLGISTHNYFTNAWSWEIDDSTGKMTGIIPDTTDYIKNKLNVTYLELPLELRFITHPTEKTKSFRFKIGFRAGLLINGMEKYKTKDVKTKTKNNIPLEDFQYGVTARIGYGALTLFGYYGLKEMFTSKGPVMIPYSLGFSFQPKFNLTNKIPH